MEREIIFRGKRLDNGQWVEGHYLCLHSAEPLHIIVDEHGQYHRVDPGTVGQFTGLIDKSGKKIFAGDIVKATWICDQCDICGPIIWWYGCFAIRDKITGDIPAIDLFNNHEVNGNIYDSPELLDQ